MEIKPVAFKEASNFINLYHRHHNATVGCKFCIGLYDNAKLIGCAVCGRPVSRYYDEVVRCKDCIFGKYDDDLNMILCKRIYNLSDGEYVYNDLNDFCSYGERKDGNGNG